MESQDVLAGNIYKTIDAETRIAEGLPELNWLVKNILPKNDLSIIGGKPKVGKTRLSIGLARCLLVGDLHGMQGVSGSSPLGSTGFISSNRVNPFFELID